MDVTRLLSSLLLLFCTMISGVGGSKTLPMDQPIFSTKSIYHGYSLLCISASSKAILFSFIFLLWVSLPLCLWSSLLCRDVKGSPLYIFLCSLPLLLLIQTGQIPHSQQSAFLCTHSKHLAMKSNLPIYASNRKCNHWSTCETSVYYQLSKAGKSCILYPSPGYITELTCSAFICWLWEGAKISLRKCPIWIRFSQQLGWDSGIKISTSCSIKETNEELKMTISLFCASCFSLGKSHLLHWGRGGLIFFQMTNTAIYSR